MNYKGVIIEEGLEDVSILDRIKILETKIEKVSKKHQTPYLKQWTLDTVEIPEEKVDEFAKKISHCFDKKHPDWYADFKNENFHYIIFKNKIFKVVLKNPILYQDARKYGMSLGIPEYQLDFHPEVQEWER